MLKIFGKLIIAVTAALLPSAVVAQDHWVATWAAAPMEVKNTHLGESTLTIRNIVHLSIGGKVLRLALSNEFGTQPLFITGASVGEIESVAAGSLNGNPVRVTFGGKPGTTISPGQMLYSDPVPFATQPLENLAVSLLLPAQEISHPTQHNASHGTNFTAPGDQVMQPSLQNGKTVAHWPFLKGVSVMAPAEVGTLVCFGDSITDGTGTANDTNERWPDDVSAWLQARKGATPVAVINEGIGGNRVLHDKTGPAAIDRFSRDVLDQDGVRSVIVLEGINDISHTNAAFADTYLPVTADDMISGMLKLIQQAHAHRLKIYGATLTPYLGAKYYWPGGDQIRMTVNAFIRSGKAFDGYVDFEKLVQDPAQPLGMVPAYEHGDHLHPSPAGYRIMAEGVEYTLYP